MLKTDYKPINCDFYDHFEIHAMRGTWLQIDYNQGRNINSLIARIKNTETKDKEEFIITDNGLRIRMDHVKQITPLNPSANMRAQLLDKMDYNYWANKRIIAHLHGHQELPENVSLWMSHILNAHDRWNKRILGLHSQREVWDVYPSDQWQEINDEVHEDSYSILRNDNPERIITYQDSEGGTHESVLSEIVYHIINHGTYHGGQIAYELRNSGLTALPTDYVVWKRS